MRFQFKNYRYWQIYRPDFQQLLADGARNAGAHIQFDKKVMKVDAEAGKVTLADGTTVAGDLVICADGKRPGSCPKHCNQVIDIFRHTF